MAFELGASGSFDFDVLGGVSLGGQIGQEVGSAPSVWLGGVPVVEVCTGGLECQWNRPVAVGHGIGSCRNGDGGCHKQVLLSDELRQVVLLECAVNFFIGNDGRLQCLIGKVGAHRHPRRRIGP